MWIAVYREYSFYTNNTNSNYLPTVLPSNVSQCYRTSKTNEYNVGLLPGIYSGAKVLKPK